MIAIGKTFKESYADVRENFRPWVKVAFTPFVLYLIGVISMGIGLYLSGGFETLMQQGTVMQDTGPTSASAGFFNFIYYVLYMLAILVWYVNGFRYAALGEGGDTWWRLSWDRRLLMMFLYQILFVVLFAAYGGIAAGITIGVYFLTESIFLAALLGTLFFLGLFYLMGRLMLVFLNVAIDQPEPLRTSWQVMRGNVLRLFGLFILISLAIIALSIVGGLIIGVTGVILGFIGGWLGAVIFALYVPFALFVWLVSAAMTMKAMALVNKQLS
jgi:hypothetical protein